MEPPSLGVYDADWRQCSFSVSNTVLGTKPNTKKKLIPFLPSVKSRCQYKKTKNTRQNMSVIWVAQTFFQLAPSLCHMPQNWLKWEDKNMHKTVPGKQWQVLDKKISGRGWKVFYPDPQSGAVRAVFSTRLESRRLSQNWSPLVFWKNTHTHTPIIKFFSIHYVSDTAKWFTGIISLNS